MRGKLKELWHRHLDRKPWIFRDQDGLAYLFAPQDDVADYCERSAVIDNPSFLACLRRLVKPGELFVDLDPVIGGVAMTVAKLVGEGGAVFAFAADADTYRKLVNNVALNSLTKTVRVIGRAALRLPGGSGAATLDQFAHDWNWTVIDHVRVRGGPGLADLQRSAGNLLKEGRIRNILMDDADSASIQEAADRLSPLGFSVQAPDGTGQLQPLSAVSPGGVSNLVASRKEAGHG